VVKSCQLVLCEAERQHLAWWINFPMRLLEAHARALSSMRHSKVTIRAQLAWAQALGLAQALILNCHWHIMITQPGLAGW
jgi:hypothetical protein